MEYATMKNTGMRTLSYTVLAIVLAFIAQEVTAQQIPLFSQYMFDKITINPGYAGNTNTVAATVIYKEKMAGIEGAPKTQVFSIHAPIQSKFMGVGLKVIHDEIGITRQTGIMGIYSYHMGLGNGKLSLGLEGGVLNHSSSFSTLLKSDQVDDVIPLDKESTLAPDASFGIYYSTEKMYFSGSVYHLMPSRLSPAEYERNPEAQLYKHFYLANGYEWAVGESFLIKPSWLLKLVQAAPTQFDLNLNLTYKEMFTMGSSFRSGDGLVFLFEYYYKQQIKIGYAYDYTTSKLASYSSGSHEILLSYTVNLMEPAMKKITDPRYYY